MPSSYPTTPGSVPPGVTIAILPGLNAPAVRSAVACFSFRFKAQAGRELFLIGLFETQPSRFVRHTRRCEAEFPVPISDAGACVPHTRRGTRVGAGCRPPHRRSLQKNPKKPSPRGIKEISRSNFSSLSRKKRASELRGPTVMSGAERRVNEVALEKKERSLRTLSLEAGR